MSIVLRSLAVFPLAALLTACGGVDWQSPPRVDTAEVDRGFTQSPDPTVSIEPVKGIALVGATGYGASHYTGPAANLGLAAAAAVVAYVVYDPLAPNWTMCAPASAACATFSSRKPKSAFMAITISVWA